MVIVVDTNILIQCIINVKGKMASLVLQNSPHIHFVIPEFVISEIKEKEQKVYSSSKLKPPHFRENLKTLLSAILTIQDEEIPDHYFKKAYEIVKEIDPDDVVQVALSITLDALLWTDDYKLQRGLKRKGFRSAINTKEFKDILKCLR